MNEGGRVRAGLGLPSFLVIVTVLAMTVLGVLTFNLARADAALQSRHEELSRAYYAAAAKAEETVSLLDAALLEAYRRSENETDYENACRTIVAAGDAAIEWLDGTRAVFYTDAGGKRRLRVDIQRNDFEKAHTVRLIQINRTLEDMMDWSGEAIPLIA